MKAMVQAEQLCYNYRLTEQAEVTALKNISFTLEPGEHLAIVGANGSGKTSLARLLNALELADSGSLSILGLTPDSLANIFAIRSLCGLVFQNPDNQIVGNTVEEDTAFGPENLALPQAEIARRVATALAQVGLSEQALRLPSELSGGQKQKLAIAGVLALEPKCIILDEAYSMLDPVSAAEIALICRRLQREQNISLITITHHMSEAIEADKILLLNRGELRYWGSPRQLFQEPRLLRAEGLDLPAHLDILLSLAEILPQLSLQPDIFTEAEAVQALQELWTSQLSLNQGSIAAESLNSAAKPTVGTGEKILELNEVFFAYDAFAAAEPCLTSISLQLEQGEILALCGPSGSGKSTLIALFNGLLQPQSGSVKAFGLDLAHKANIPQVRRKLALLFQYPEQQLFEATVFADIAYGPRQLGLNEVAVAEAVESAMAAMNIDPELAQRSPFSLSGGQKRRVAVAGVLAMQPEILVFDEPTAGLDPQGSREMLQLLQALRQQGKTIVLVSHQMEQVAQLADRVIILTQGRILAAAPMEEVFSNLALLKESKLTQPACLRFLQLVNVKLGLNLTAFNNREAAQQLAAAFWTRFAHV